MTEQACHGPNRDEVDLPVEAATTYDLQELANQADKEYRAAEKAYRAGQAVIKARWKFITIEDMNRFVEAFKAHDGVVGDPIVIPARIVDVRSFT